MVDHVRGELTELLGLRACRFDYGTLLGQPPRLRQDRRLSVDARRWDLTADGRPEERSSCAPTATATVGGASCSPRVRGPCLRSRPVWWR
ncbi:hypothetical protein ACFQ0G_41885 [Streptomyces chiangmaiensis]